MIVKPGACKVLCWCVEERSTVFPEGGIGRLGSCWQPLVSPYLKTSTLESECTTDVNIQFLHAQLSDAGDEGRDTVPGKPSPLADNTWVQSNIWVRWASPELCALIGFTIFSPTPVLFVHYAIISRNPFYSLR